MKDFDALSSEYGKVAGRGGNAGKANTTGGRGGASASGGIDAEEAGAGGESGEAGEPGTAGRTSAGGAGKGAGGKAAGGRSGSGGRGGGGRSGAGGGGKGGVAGADTCANGLATCLGAEECVTDLTVGNPTGVHTVTDCGACGTSCSVTNASSAACTAGQCAPSCESGFDDCNATSKNDGCEADLTSPLTCGSCDHKCSPVGVATNECATGVCIPTCSAAYADCNGSISPAPNDGCEVYLDALDQCKTACGLAPVACSPLQVCNAGICGAAAGVAVLTTPLAEGAGKMRFADIFPEKLPLEGGSVTVRVYAPGATGGTLELFLNDYGSQFSPTLITTNLKDLSDKWVDISVPIAMLGSFNANNVKQINLDVNAVGPGPFLNPTVVYVDHIHTSNRLIDDGFDTSTGTMVKSSLTTIAGSSLTWAPSVP
jgi:hypothetical protein